MTRREQFAHLVSKHEAWKALAHYREGSLAWIVNRSRVDPFHFMLADEQPRQAPAGVVR